MARRKELTTLRGYFNWLTQACPAPDGKTIALVGGPELHGENALKIVEIATGKTLVSQQFARERVPTVLVYSPDGEILAAGCKDNVVRLWDVVP